MEFDTREGEGIWHHVPEVVIVLWVLTPSDHHYPPCDVTRIISKHKDTEYGQTQYMVEWAPEHLTEWDIQLQLDDGFHLISSTPTSVCLPAPSPAACSIKHDPLHTKPTSACCTCPHFAVHSQCRPDRKSTRLNSSHRCLSRMPSSA